MAFEDNIYDGHAIESQLEQVEYLIGRLPETALVDRGCKGRESIMGFNIKIPDAVKIFINQIFKDRLVIIQTSAEKT